MKSGAGLAGEERISHSACARTVHGVRELQSRGVCSCACRRQRVERVPRPIFRDRVFVASIRIEEITVTASATATVELGFRRERTASNRQDEAQNATGESILHALFLSASLCISLAHKRLFLAHLAVIPTVVKSVSLGRSPCDLSLEKNQFPASRFLIEELLWLRNETRMRLPVLTISESQSSKKTLCVLPEEIIYERKGNHAALTPLEDMSAGRGQAGGGPPQNCEKVFIQRDYSEGTMVKFQTRFPTELESRLDRQLFEYTINQLNNYFAEAERASCSTYCESCLYCLTGYLISICTETHYEKCLRKVAKFISEQNDRVYKPRGLLLTDPTTRGLRLIEISVLDRPAS